MLDDEASSLGEVDADDCASLGFHTILFVFGGVVIDFGATSFGFHTILFFFGDVGFIGGITFFPFLLHEQFY